jgi:DNA-binding SARP family transcriptional activator
LQVHFGVLGPLSVFEVRDGRRESLLPTATKKRVLLAALICRAGEVVPTQSLIRELWTDRPPRQARGALHVYVAQVRNQLAAGDGTAIISTEGDGYVLNLGDAEFDRHAFESLVVRGRTLQAKGDLRGTAECLERALGLWRGPALVGLADGPMLSVETTCLNEEHLRVIENRLEIDLALGRHRDIIPELIGLVHGYPLHETFYRQLILAYYRAERQADALHTFRQLSERLRRDLGVQPCRSVQQLHLAVLNADPALEHQLSAAS